MKVFLLKLRKRRSIQSIYCVHCFEWPHKNDNNNKDNNDNNNDDNGNDKAAIETDDTNIEPHVHTGNSVIEVDPPLNPNTKPQQFPPFLMYWYWWSRIRRRKKCKNENQKQQQQTNTNSTNNIGSNNKVDVSTVDTIIKPQLYSENIIVK